jgi:hypothetical protein
MMNLRTSLLVLLVSAIGVGCSAVPSDAEVTVPALEWETLSDSCDALLESTPDDDDVLVSSAEGADDLVVLDTPDGSCVAERETLAQDLRKIERFPLALRVAVGHAMADPSPHPDKPSNVVGADPQPHPDHPRDVVAKDPQPHPDRNTESDDDTPTYTIVIIIEVGGDGGEPVENGTSPTPAPPSASNT